MVSNFQSCRILIIWFSELDEKPALLQATGYRHVSPMGENHFQGNGNGRKGVPNCMSQCHGDGSDNMSKEGHTDTATM